ncbi:MAG: metallophosphoesterase family protein, partial [Candidatus Lokiarchaeota archaeon]
MTKYGIISDTHIDRSYNREKLSLLLEQLREIFKDVEQIFHAGDIIEKSFLEELNKIAPVRAVNGET